MSYDADDIRDALTARDIRHVLSRCGFQLNGVHEGQASSVLGPPELGEGKRPNFSVDLERGLVNDFGDTYGGSVFDVVKDVHGLDFNEACTWIVEECNLTIEPRGDGAPARRPRRKQQAKTSSSPSAVATHDQVNRWHERLMSTTDAAESARRYLTDERGISTDVLKTARLGLAHKPNDHRATWWVMIPVPNHRQESRPIVAVKGFGFDPERCTWVYNDGRKVARNGGPAALYDLTPGFADGPRDAPVLLCEGELDALCAFAHGFNAVTGTAGARTFKTEWARRIAQLEPAQHHSVVLCYDGDEDGREGARDAATDLHDAGSRVRIARLPDDQDVNDVLLDGGRAALQEHIDAALPYPIPDVHEQLHTAVQLLDEHGIGHPIVEPSSTQTKDTSPPSSHPLSDKAPLDNCEPIAAPAFEALPGLLREACGFWSRKHKRDVFLTSALGILSGCLPNVVGYWGADVPSPHGPNLYTAFVAGAAGGKSAGVAARHLAEDVHRRICERSEEEIKNWKLEKQNAENTDEPFTKPEPVEESLWTPANSSYSHLLHTLDAQDGRGVIFSSEIDTVADALGQDWGAFDSLLRKAYHHEADDQGRRESGTLRIEDPHLSLVLGGTVQQFVDLIESPENGLFSRMSLYFFEASDPYQSQRPTEEGIERTNRLRALGKRIGALWADLDERDEPIRFKLLDPHWRVLDEAVEPLHRDVQRMGYSHLLSIPRRSGLWAFRIAMILAVLRAHEEGAPLRQLDALEPTDEEINAAASIASTYADHALRFGRDKLGASEPASARDRRIAAILSTCPAKFMTADAREAVEDAGFDVNASTVTRDLQAAEKRGLIRRRDKRGAWRQIA